MPLILREELGDVVELHQLGEEAAHRLRAGLGGDEHGLRTGDREHLLGDRAALGRIGVQEPFKPPAASIQPRPNAS
ncbi:MAG: hypothetical protein JWP66_1425 [Naasia sp.]|nr:hypothetical protein [Naasia sp.]